MITDKPYICMLTLKMPGPPCQWDTPSDSVVFRRWRVRFSFRPHIFHGHSLPTADSGRAVVSYLEKYGQ